MLMTVLLVWAVLAVAVGLLLGRCIKYGMKGVDEDEA